MAAVDMQLLVALPDGVHQETLDAPSGWTNLDLRAAIERSACERLGNVVAALLSYPDGTHVPMDPPQFLAALGLDASDATVKCELVSAPRIQRCEPPFGPVGGGTLIRVRGSGFRAESGFGGHGDGTSAAAITGGGARLSFGSGCTVPCWRGSDDELLCRAPPHPEGIVSVVLLGCVEAAGSSGAAAFEFASEGRMCDLIFATTNSNCPLRNVKNGESAAHMRL